MISPFANCLRLGFVLLVAGLCLTPGPVFGQEEAAKHKPERVLYKTTTNAKGEAVELYLHVFKPEGWTANDKRPVIVFFFGGGWVGGTPTQFYPHCEELVGLGMVAMSAEYRVNRTHGTAPQACVEDGKSAIRFVRANAKSLGIDPDKIVAGGGSAGGHVAASTGTLKSFEAKDEDPSVSSVPSLMILFNPVIDTSIETGYGGKRIKPDPLALSPLHNIHKDVPPALIFHGDADRTVRIDSVRRFTKACWEKKIPCVLKEYEGAGHGFFNHARFRKPKQGTPDYYALTMKRAREFLAKHGYVENDTN